MPHDKPIGIDLGTTNSAMAWVDEAGRSAMIPNAEGEFITPSVVFFSESEVVVGKTARTAITTHPEMVAQWVKRDMGAPYYSHAIRGHFLPPEVIQACILRKLKADVVRALGSDVRAVITVPAYFDEMRRKATADAGEMAGLRVLDIVNEPTAAALAFGESLGYLSSGGGAPACASQQELIVMVYDLGGGTFDATLLRLTVGKVQTLATDGDVQLGGHDWDQRLVDYSADCFLKAHQLDPRQDPATLNRLYLDAMEAKHTLSARSRAVIQINYQGRFAEIALTREQFEEMSADLLERTSYTSRQLLGVAGLEWKDVQRVLLVGGSTRMPMVPRMLQGLSGIQPDRSVNPDEAVARGAALYAGHLLAMRAGTPKSTFQVTNVNAHSLGVEGIDTDTLRKKNVVLIPRNTPLPARYTERFATKSEGQRSIAIKVLEGESSQPGDCIAIGRTVVRDLPSGLPKGWPVEVTFEYATNGRLAVEALVPGTQHQARLELVREVGLSNEGLTRWKQPVNEAGGFNAFESAAQDVLHSAPPSPEASPSGIGSAIGWAPAKADAAGKMAVLPTPPLAASPAEPAAGQRWASGPQALTDFSPRLIEEGQGVTAASSPRATGERTTSSPRPVGEGVKAAEEPVLPLIKRTKPEKQRRIPKWVERLIGHIITLLIFAVVGYLMISHFRPDLFPRRFGGTGEQNEQKYADPAP
ncbi:MAG: Hsp70 family protein [Thermoguttaceae bacterium]|jgi:molecular chaperone DnaK